MRLWDFDKTIYDGDSTIDFYKFCVKKKPSILIYLPYQTFSLFFFILRLISKKQWKEYFFIFLKKIDTPKMVKAFWLEYDHKIKLWYRRQDHQKDIVISASPSFLLEPLKEKLNLFDVLATKVDVKTGLILGENCHDQEKVRLLREKYPQIEIKEAYSDSLKHDRPMLELASKAFLVKGDHVILWKR